MNYREEVAYNSYLLAMAECNNSLDDVVTTLCAIGEGCSDRELKVINESIKDKIKSLWEKIKDFINNIWKKFLERMNRIISTDAEYLDQYKDIILNKKPDDVNITMIKHDNGIRNLTSIKIKKFSPQVPEEYTDLQYKKDCITGKVGMKDITPDDDWKEYTHSMFLGGIDEEEFILSSLNMTDLFNFCRNFDKIRNTIENDKKTLESECDKLMNELEKAATKAASDAAKEQLGSGDNKEESSKTEDGKKVKNIEIPTIQPPK